MTSREGVQIGNYYLPSKAEADETLATTGQRVPYRAEPIDEEFGTRDQYAVTGLELDPEFGCTAVEKIARLTGQQVLESYPEIW